MKLFFFNMMFLLLSIPVFAGTETGGVSAEDFYFYQEITELTLSPNGELLAYVVQEPEKENNRYVSAIWIYHIRSQHHFQLTASGTGRNFSPTWSPDSRFLAFSSTRSGRPQIWLISLEGGDAWSLTDLASGAWSPQWSPDGHSVAFLSNVQTPVPIQVFREQGRQLIDPRGREFARDVKVIKRLRYRAGTEYFDDSFSHIFTIPVNGGQPTQQTREDFDNFSFAWSPDAKNIAFLSNRRGNQDLDDNLDICLVPTGGGEIRVLTDNPGTERAPVWSPDGKILAWVANTRINDFTEQLVLFTQKISQGKPEILTSKLDLSLVNPHWAPNGKSLFLLAGDRGNQHLYEISTKNQKNKLWCGGDRFITDFVISPKGNQVYFIANSPDMPSDIFALNLKNGREERLTDINRKVQRQYSNPEPVWYRSADSLKIQGWFMRPINFDSQKQYPLVVQIHGGPYWNYGNRWELEFQLLCARGYAVFYCNPRVSTSYGQEFAARDHGPLGRGRYGRHPGWRQHDGTPKLD